MNQEKIIKTEATERKLSFLQTLFDTISVPINYKDLNGVFVDCNQAFVDLAGKKKEEIIGKTPYDIWAKPSADILANIDLEILKNNLEKQDLEVEYENLFGRKGTAIFSKRIVRDGCGNKVGVVVSINDITELKKHQEELQKFKLAVDNVSDHIIITDPDGTIIYANKAVEMITGYPLNEVLGKKPSLWGRQMPRAFYENFWKAIKEGKINFTGILTNRRKNGELYTAEINISPILNNKGEVIFFVCIERDVAKIEEISRAKNEFVSVASHQLKTPLTGIKWLTEILLKNREHNLTEKQIEILKDINFSNDRIINLVNDLLSISKIEGGEAKILNLKEVEISELISEVIKGLKPVAENSKIDLETSIALPKNYKLNIDREKITQAMNNLVSNAIKYSKPGGGKVTVSAGIYNDDLIFSVKDDGIGISLKDQRRLFEKFFRADNAVLSQTEGTGLGLPIVKFYVESHGGKVWFESRENEGSTFHFSLKTNPVKNNEK